MADTPRLHTNRQTVSLSFDSTLIQSTMRLDAPDELVLDYTRALMGWTLLTPSARHALMVGLGGGSMVKWLYRHRPELHQTVVEIHPGVIDHRRDFHVPDDDDRLSVVCADGAAWLKQPPRTYDLIIIDGYDERGMPEALCSRAFFERCRQALSPDGVLAVNINGSAVQVSNVLNRLRRAFDGQVLSFDSDEGNDIAFAATASTLARARSEWAWRVGALDPATADTLATVLPRLKPALDRLPIHPVAPPP